MNADEHQTLISGYHTSNCCGAPMTEQWLDTEICPECKEHCNIETEYK